MSAASVLTFDSRFLTTQTAADARLAVKVDHWHGPGLGDGQTIFRVACYARTHVTGRVRCGRNVHRAGHFQNSPTTSIGGFAMFAQVIQGKTSNQEAQDAALNHGYKILHQAQPDGSAARAG